ncbi:MAG: hypothetical protein HY720_27050 [Planctomycetes bacterium]|nr:hypothetical protein [Planctomycetota bacterium]
MRNGRRNEEDGKTERIVLDRRREINDIKRRNPDLTMKVDAFERDLRDKLRHIHALICQLHLEDRELVSTAVIHGLHRMTDETFL